MWFVVAIGIAGVTRNSNPQLALRWWPGDGRALAEIAQQAITDHAADRKRIAQQARDAIKANPTNPSPFVTLALATQADNAQARREIGYAEALSRRDLGSQLWLIEDSVGRGDIDKALLHYDIALRTSQHSADLLFPILIQATSDPEIAKPLVGRLLLRPQWRDSFLTQAIKEAPDSVQLAQIAEMLRRGGQPMPQGIEGTLITRLVEDGKVDVAHRIYVGLYPKERASLIRNGNFEQDAAVTSFDWILASDADLWARIGGGPSGGARLEFGASAGRGGNAARQMLVLPAGRYLISAVSGDVSDGGKLSPRLTLTCQAHGALGNWPLTIKDGATRIQAAVTIPADCTSQTLAVELSGDVGGIEDSAWIDDITIQPQR